MILHELRLEALSAADSAFPDALFSISSRQSSKTLATLTLVLALVSTHAALFDCANFSPSSGCTCRLKGDIVNISVTRGVVERGEDSVGRTSYLLARSILEPTMTQGMSAVPRKSMILS